MNIAYSCVLLTVLLVVVVATLPSVDRRDSLGEEVWRARGGGVCPVGSFFFFFLLRIIMFFMWNPESVGWMHTKCSGM